MEGLLIFLIFQMFPDLHTFVLKIFHIHQSVGNVYFFLLILSNCFTLRLAKSYANIASGVDSAVSRVVIILHNIK